MKIDPSKYDYIMYVDASGDDGFKFEKDSSSCYCAAAFLVKQEDIAHNLSILEQIKKMIGCKTTDEVKYSRIRRHRRGPEALALLRNLKGQMSCYLAFKKELAADHALLGGAKILSVACHAMALRSLDDFGFAPTEKVLIAIDRMKNTEEKPLEQLLTNGSLSLPQNQEQHFSHEVIFRDSRDANFLLIQIADLLCGTIREHFEQYEDNEDMAYFAAICPNCIRIQLMKKHNAHRMCKNGRSRIAKIVNSKNLHNVLPLLPVPTSAGAAALNFFFMEPRTMLCQHHYLFCKKA